MEALQQQFKPEFLNRVDDIIIFNPLAMEQLSKIVELRLEDLRRLLAERKISLEINDAAKRQLITQGYDINYGARPLKRAIQRMIQDPLAMKILDGEVSERRSHRGRRRTRTVDWNSRSNVTPGEGHQVKGTTVPHPSPPLLGWGFSFG